MHRRSLVQVALVCGAASLLSCMASLSPPLSAPPPTHPFLVVNTPRSEEGEVTVNLLVRGFLVRGEESPPGYGYYVYLVFMDQKDISLPQRQAAIKAFAKYSDASEAPSLNVALEKQALFLAPVDRPLEPLTLEETILARYDYARADVLTAPLQQRGYTLSPGGKVQHKLPSVFLLGSTTPIERLPEMEMAQLVILDLMTNPQAVEAAIDRLKVALKTPGTKLARHNTAEGVLSFLNSMGAAVLSLASLNKPGDGVP